jgi:TonB family protein
MNSELKSGLFTGGKHKSGFSLRLCDSARNIAFQIAALLACASIANAFSILKPFQEKSPVRVAVIGFTQKAANYDEKAARLLEAAISDSIKMDARVSLIEGSMLRPALAGIGYEGSINLRREDARRIGAAIGCDFFITGKAEAIVRSYSKEDTHIEALIGVMIVDGRSGDLAYFDFIEEKASTAEAALSKVANSLKSKADFYAEKMMNWRDEREVLRKDIQTKDALIEPVEDIPEEGSSRSEGFKPPEFLSRVKPEYTSQAERSDISATVEASVIFSANGEIGRIEITRWAGFGLDQSAIEAIQKLKFKPAMRDGKAVSVRATVQYNFRRVEK